MSGDLLGNYQNGNTWVRLYQDGTKERLFYGDGLAEFPESMDVKITNWCDAGCAYCHEMSTTRGKHANLEPTIDLITQLPPGVEIAIGGGHPLAHPDFEAFIEILTDHGIVCNVTVNEHHFEKELPRIEEYVVKGWIKGVGYSYSTKPCEWQYEHLVTHVIVGVTPYSHLESIVVTNPKVLLLGYKSVGRGIKFKTRYEVEVDNVIKTWYRYLFTAARQAHLSFDNLAIEQLNPKRLFANQAEYNQFYMGRDGCYSMYLDAVKQEYAQSSTHPVRRVYDTQIRKMFDDIHPN